MENENIKPSALIPGQQITTSNDEDEGLAVGEIVAVVMEHRWLVATITSAFLVGHIVWLFVWLNTDSHVGMNPVAEWISYLVAAVYFPFAMMMIVFQERFAACAPWVSLPAMFRCMPGSKMALGLSAVAMVAVHGLKKIPFVGDLLAAGAGLVLFIIANYCSIKSIIMLLSCLQNTGMM